MKTIGIEAFLSWAYRDELPKEQAPAIAMAKAVTRPTTISSDAYGSGWDGVSRQGELMADMVSDGRPNGYGVIAMDAWYGEPTHPDALAAHEAVSKLSKVTLNVPEGWAPLGGLGLTEDEAEDALRRALPRVATMEGEGDDVIWRLRFKPAELVRRFAILGGAPDWSAEVPKRRLATVCGKPAWFRMVEFTSHLGRPERREVDGFNKRSQRPYPGAYRKTVLEPDPMLAAVERAEYEVWHAALCLLVEMLNEPGALTAHRLAPPLAPMRPWEDIAMVAETA